MDQEPPKCQAIISGRDRISELPDAIICEILSNLPTKDAVATSILSKRWKDQWTCCFNLDFSDADSVLLNPNFSLDLYVCYYEFVKNVIALNKSPCIRKFRLHSEYMHKDDFAECIDLISRRNVEEIKLEASPKIFPLTMPHSLFTCQTMVFLEIALHAICDIPPSVYLPSLKVFRVDLYEPSNAVTTKLFCGLPVLEHLSVSIWLFDFEEITVNIFAPSLMRLKLKLFDGDESQIIVKAPSLKELDIYDDCIANYVFEELPLDVKARLRTPEICTAEYEDEELDPRVIQFLNGISSVKSLALSSCILGTYLRNASHHVAVFPNVTCLEVDVTSCCGFTYLLYFIDRLPNLVFLVFVLEMVPAHTKSFKLFVPLEHVPQCLLLHLKKIEVKGFEGQQCELDWLEYILKFAQVLDEVVIYTRNMVLEERIWHKLSLFPWGSTNCRLKILQNISIDQ